MQPVCTVRVQHAADRRENLTASEDCIPDGLQCEHIPRLARIVAVADAFDYITSDRPYRKGMPAEVAFEEVKNMAGKQFDPTIAEAFRRIKLKVVQEMQSETQKMGISNLVTLRLAN